MVTCPVCRAQRSHRCRGLQSHLSWRFPHWRRIASRGGPSSPSGRGQSGSPKFALAVEDAASTASAEPKQAGSADWWAALGDYDELAGYHSAGYLLGLADSILGRLDERTLDLSPLSGDTLEAPVPEIVQVVQDAYHLAQRWRYQSFLLSEGPDSPAAPHTPSSASRRRTTGLSVDHEQPVTGKGAADASHPVSLAAAGGIFPAWRNSAKLSVVRSLFWRRKVSGLVPGRAGKLAVSSNCGLCRESVEDNGQGAGDRCPSQPWSAPWQALASSAMTLHRMSAWIVPLDVRYRLAVR